jgi:hypothetical protein
MIEPTKERNCKTCWRFNASFCICALTNDMMPRIVLKICNKYVPIPKNNIPDIRSKGITECTTKCYECSDIDCPSHPINNEELP